MAGKPIDLTGQTFNRWTVKRASSKRDVSGCAMWYCVCECGTKRRVAGSQLRLNRSKSCGCLSVDSATKHGFWGMPEHKVWDQMIRRCTNPDCADYPRYGGRGISVSKSWMTFENFYADMGPRPEGKSIERIKNHLGYSKENCRWASRRTQNNNTRSNVVLTYQGKSRTVAQWARKLKIQDHTIRNRLRLGWDVDRIFQTT